MSDKTGGPAFPSPPGVYISDIKLGMTLRDWFAGQALAGLLASETMEVANNIRANADETWPSAGARIAYNFADAMLAAREKESPDGK